MPITSLDDPFNVGGGFFQSGFPDLTQFIVPVAEGRKFEPPLPERRTGVPAIVIPFPIPKPKPKTPVPFPSGPAANDPIARFSKIPGLFRIGGGLISVAIIAADILRLVQEERINVQMIEQDLEIDAILERGRKRKARETPVRVDPEIVLVPRPVEIPEIIVTAPRTPSVPRPVIDPVLPGDLPEAPVPLPLPVPAPVIPTPTLPQPSPQTVPAGLPKTAPAPRRRVLPGLLPILIPASLPAFFPLPFSTPVSTPKLRPIGDTLTSLRPVVQQSAVIGSISFAPSADPSALTDTDLDRRCRDRQKKKQRKNRCDEGFFRETRTGKTEFTTWRTRNCATGSIVGDQSGATDIFGGI